MKSLPYIPGKGYGTLPLCDAHTNANLLTVFLDAQHDFLCDRLYAVAARVVAHDGGEYAGGRLLVRLSDGPPDSPDRERHMLACFLSALLRALPEKAAPDEKGRLRAPLHLVFWNEFVWKSLLAALARHLDSLLSEFPVVYDLLTQKAAFASPMTTFLDRELGCRNLPLVCPSLTNVASYLGFDWGEVGGEDDGSDTTPYRRAFRARLFDAAGRFEDTDADNAEFGGAFYTARARFNSQVPLEYAYAAWGELPIPEKGGADPYRAYRGVTEDMLIGLMKRRLKALAHVADGFLSDTFRGNPKVRKTPFDLPELGEYHDRAETLAGALEEFCLIERHVGLGDWKAKRLPSPEERLLRGDTLIAQYHQDEQPAAPAVEDESEEGHGRLPSGTLIRLRLWDAETGTDLTRALALSGVKAGDRLLLSPRWVKNDWAGDDENSNTGAEPQAPTPEQMLYSTRAEVVAIEGIQNVKSPLWVVVEVVSAWGSDSIFQFPAAARLALTDGAAYTLDLDPNNPLGQWQAEVARRLGALELGALDGHRTDDDEYHAFYDRITDRISAEVLWPQEAADGQVRFLAGLDALRGAGLWIEELEAGKRRLVGAHGDDALLLVQGPPGTGKSTTTALAVLSRMSGALAAGLPLRVYLSCKTHAATDVLLGKVADVQERLAQVRDRQPGLFARYFHPRLPDMPLARLAPKQGPPVGIVALGKENNKRRRGRVPNWDWLQAQEQVVVAGTPGGIYQMVKGRWQADIFGHKGCDLLVLDEASQMSLPEAMLAALPLKATGQVIVVGDPRQMPPIVAHDWANEPRRTFQTFRAFESVYHALLPLDVPQTNSPIIQTNSPIIQTNSPITQIKFERSFRVHRDVAEFLRREVYRRDGINYYSTNEGKMPAVNHEDPFVAAVLDPDQPIVVIVHDEEASQTLNAFEGELLAPILGELADPFRYALDAETGLGIVVPHRAQRAALKQKFPGLADAVDTVERYQGGEREVIVISATESDPDYLAEASEFLLHPQRMTVALSRARKKLILVASKSIFSHRSTDGGLFRASGLWKNLLRKTCTERLWEGKQSGQQVMVCGKSVEKE